MLIKIMAGSCFIALTMTSFTIFSMEVDQNMVGWEDDHSMPPPPNAVDEIDQASENPDALQSTLPQFHVPTVHPFLTPPSPQPSTTFSQPQQPIAHPQATPLVPPLQIPLYFKSRQQEPAQPAVPFLTLPAVPETQPIQCQTGNQGPKEQFHRQIISDIKTLLTYQQEHLELCHLLNETSKQLINLNFAVLTRLSIIEAQYSYEKGQGISPVQHVVGDRFKKFVEENSNQQEAVSRAQSSTSLKELLKIQQATMQRISEILNVDLQKQAQ